MFVMNFIANHLAFVKITEGLIQIMLNADAKVPNSHGRIPL